MLFPQMVVAGQFESLTPLLINLNGWDGDAPEGMDMDMGSVKMVQAMRQYARDNQSLKAMIIVGNAILPQGQQQPTNIDSSAVLIKTSEIDGYQVMQRHAKQDAEGVVIIAISASDQKPTTFVLDYTGLNPGEALEHAKTFDWNQIKEVTTGLE
jgi:hypothetical protein